MTNAAKTAEVVWPEDQDIPSEALSLADEQTLYTVPLEYLEEVLASEMVQYLRNYHAAVVARRSARHTGDNKQAETMGRAIAYARNAIALIHHEHPNVRALAEDIMHLESVRARRARDEAHKAPPED